MMMAVNASGAHVTGLDSLEQVPSWDEDFHLEFQPVLNVLNPPKNTLLGGILPPLPSLCALANFNTPLGLS